MLSLRTVCVSMCSGGDAGRALRKVNRHSDILCKDIVTQQIRLKTERKRQQIRLRLREQDEQSGRECRVIYFRLMCLHVHRTQTIVVDVNFIYFCLV